MSVIAIISTTMCQHSDTAQCKVIGNSTMIHTKCCFFNVLLCLLSPYEQQVKVHILLSTTDIRTGRAIQPSYPSCGTIDLMVFSFTPLSCYLPVLLERRHCGLLFWFARLWKQKSFLSLLDIGLVPPVFLSVAL
jgi:hypothetical protein